jgi:DNA-directed RNA polymerase beta subunit
MGNEKEYKPFPLIGEEIQNGILCARRRIDYNTILDDFKTSNFLKTKPTDQLFYCEGVIEDITVYSNFNESEIKYEYNKPIVDLLNDEYKYYFNICKYLSELKKKFIFEDDANYLLQYCKDYIDPTLKFSYENTEFEGCLIKFTIANKVKVLPGSKLAGRYGNKGKH